MKKLVFAVVALSIVGGAHAQSRNPAGAKATAKPIAELPDVVTTVIYDTGAPADLIRNDVSSGGNLFNTNLGNPLLGGTVYGISFYVGQTVGASVGFTFFPNPPVVSSYFIVPVNGAQFNAFTFTAVNVGTTFLAGVSAYLGFVSDSANGQGFHGGQINWNTNDTFNTYPGENAMVRVTGDLVPVELMKFDVQ
ncbi:MAG: hypothetical protein R2991_02105 [Thermoanaerobaculia bacterium]